MAKKDDEEEINILPKKQKFSTLIFTEEVRKKQLEEYNLAQKNIAILNGVLAMQFDHSDPSQLDFYVGQASQNLYLICTTKTILKRIYQLFDAAIKNYLIDIDSPLLSKPRNLKTLIDCELVHVSLLMEELEELDEKIGLRLKLMQTLIATEREKMKNDFFLSTQSKQP